uniref:Uncharacterized protein n=1 Tax=Hordeum vulgare subsp. vulgare TaxID=112509 RepID=A0A8I6X3Z2_HORVV
MGRKYTIHGVTIWPNFEELACRFINHTYECSFSARTFVESLSLEFLTYPKHLMSIHEVMRCTNKTFVRMHSNIYNTNTEITFVYQFN